MPEGNLIYVNGKPFLGRVEEQKQFRAALREVLNPPRGETLPYVFLLYGDGGIGKTTLARRYRDIATGEKPFRGNAPVLWVDWDEERLRFAAQQVGREYISADTVFDVIFTAAQRQGWEKHFDAYRKTLEKRRQAEHQAAQALTSGEGRDELAPLRSAGAAALARIMRQGLPAIGQTGEDLSKAFLEEGIKVGADQASALRAELERRLRARMGVEQFDLFVNPHEGLARALADGLKRRAGHKGLLVVLDTYEIVDRADTWVRLVMQAAGPRLLWVLSGRDDLLNSRQFGTTYFKGYAEDFPRRLVAYDVRQLALEDVRTYFAARVPERPLDGVAAEAVRRATRGIPLAMAQAAEMWQRGASLAEIVGDTDDATPGKEIVARMTGRYLLHAVTPEDCHALYALALARGDLEVLRAMLRPDGDVPFDLKALLRRLQRDYASVYAGENRLHDEPQAFFIEHLKAPLERTSEAVRGLLQRAEAALRARLDRIEREYPLIEECHADEDWLKATLDLTETLFWLDEEVAWRWLVPRFVESLAYSRDLRRGLLEVAGRWEKTLSARGRRRLKALRVTEDEASSTQDEGVLLDELARAAQSGWLSGEGEAERRAILAWRRGRRLARQERYAEALVAYEQAGRSLPERGAQLKEHLGEALYDLAGQLLWPGGRGDAVYAADAERILPRVVACRPQQPWEG